MASDDQERIIIRLPDGMRERLKAVATANGRSMTAEVVAALEVHLTRLTLEDRVRRIEAKLGIEQ